MKKAISPLKRTLLVAVSLLVFSAQVQAQSAAGQDRYDTVGKTLEKARLSSDQAITSGSAENITQALVETVTYLDELARSGKTDTRTLDKAEMTAAHLGKTILVLQGIDIEAVEKDLTNPEKAMAVLGEMMSDTARAMSFRKGADGKYVWGVKEAINKEKLTQAALQNLGQFVNNSVSEMNTTNIMREDFLLKFNWVVDKSLKNKAIQEGYKKMVPLAYLGLAVATFLHPPIDLVIDRTYYSTFYSSIIYLSSFLALFVAKTQMSAAKTVEALQALARDLKNPQAAIARVKNSSSKAMTCEGFLASF